MKNAKVALARKPAVVMHQMLTSGKAFSLNGLPQAAAKGQNHTENRHSKGV